MTGISTANKSSGLTNASHQQWIIIMLHSTRTIADYDALFGPIRKTRAEKSGKQPGDPVKAAAAILTLMESPNPPAHLLLGSDALARQKLVALNQEIS